MSKNNFFLPLFSFLILASLKGMDPHNFHSLIIPGQNGGGGEAFHNNHIINTPETLFTSLQSWSQRDLGQNKSIAHLEQQLQQHRTQHPHQQLLLYGISQGTATLLNLLAKKSQSEQDALVRCIVLESVLGSGNNAIIHATQSIVPITPFIPFRRMVLPLVGKIIFPHYTPWGQQALTSAQNLSPNIPVVIMHNRNDPVLPINDARQLYCILRNNDTNANVYFFETKEYTNPSYERAHLNILDGDRERFEKIIALQKIYKIYGLPYKEIIGEEKIDFEKINLKPYQPSVEEVNAEIAKSSKTQSTICTIIDTTTSVSIATRILF